MGGRAKVWATVGFLTVGRAKVRLTVWLSEKAFKSNMITVDCQMDASIMTVIDPYSSKFNPVNSNAIIRLITCLFPLTSSI